jgi:hypothetical protein
MGRMMLYAQTTRKVNIGQMPCTASPSGDNGERRGDLVILVNRDAEAELQHSIG